MLKLSHRRDLTAGPTGGLLASLAGHVFGSGGARLGLSQKGDLPLRRAQFSWSKVADALSSYMGQGPLGYRSESAPPRFIGGTVTAV